MAHPATPAGFACQTQSQLTAQGDFYYDPSDWTVKLYSTTNPASAYSDIELAQWAVNVYAGSYVTLQNLDLRYSGAKAIEISDQHDVTVTGCDMSFIGGNFINAGGSTWWRLGDTISLYANVSNITIDGNRIWQAYDAGITSQSASEACTQQNIHIQNNVIWDCGQAFDCGITDRRIVLYPTTMSKTTLLWIPAVAGRRLRETHGNRAGAQARPRT